jgi:RNA polymerase sigma-70 factor, ECF subfamily
MGMEALGRPEGITELLGRVREGEQAALNDLIPLVYRELHRLASNELRRERVGHTLQPTALVHEGFLRLFAGQVPGFSDRSHFLGIAARVMRQVLVEHARARRTRKRDGGIRTTLLPESGAMTPNGNLLEIDQALNRLEEEDPRLVNLIEMRFFAGMTAEEAAEARSESVHVIRHDLRYAKARLRRILMIN